MLVYGSKRVDKTPELSRAKVLLQRKLGEAVRRCRAELKISQEELAWRSGLHRTYIADVERGSRNISLRNISNLASALEVSICGLLSDVGKPGGPGRGLAAEPVEILLIEDSRADAAAAARELKKARLSNPVRVLAGPDSADDIISGREGRRRGLRKGPELILLAVNAPRTAGRGVLRKLKADPRTRDIPVVVLTGPGAAGEAAECLRLGAEGSIAKPFNIEAFWRVTTRIKFAWALLGPEPKSGAKPRRGA